MSSTPRPYQADAQARAGRTDARPHAARAGRSPSASAPPSSSRSTRSRRRSSTRAPRATSRPPPISQAAEAAVDAAALDLSFTAGARADLGPGGPRGDHRRQPGRRGPDAADHAWCPSIPIYVSFDGDEQVYLKYVGMALRGERESSRNAREPGVGRASPMSRAIRTRATWCSSTTSSTRTPAPSTRAACSRTRTGASRPACSRA